MATSTKSKSARKPSARKSTAKSTAKKSTAKTAGKSTAKSTAKPKPVAKPTPPTRDQKSAAAATAAMRENTRGDKRAPVSAPQVAIVRGLIGRKSTATIAKSLGFESQKQMVDHAHGRLEHLPSGATAKMVEFYSQLSGKGASKIRGRKLTAILVSL